MHTWRKQTECILKQAKRQQRQEKRERIPRERKLKNHDHAWSECPNNPTSNNFAGKSDTEIPASKGYVNDFTKKAEKIASEQKETKKKVSSKNGDCLMIQKTPIVKIREEFHDLEYEYDDEED